MNSFPVIFAVSSVWLKPLWIVLVGAAIAVAVLFALTMLAQYVMPKVSAIARATAKEAIAQPLFYIVLLVGLTGLIISPFLPYFTMGEDIKSVKELGLTFMMVLTVGFSIWTSSLSIADEIEGRTALTVLSKPIGRREFIIGKFLGILWPVAVLFIVFGTIFLGSVSYKVAYDARENSLPEPTWQQCQEQIEQISPGIAMVFMETAILASIGVAISTRLPMMANLMICTTIYLLGHLVPLIANSAVGRNPQVKFISDLLAAVLPGLGHFNVSTAIMKNQGVPLSLLGLAALYTLLYCGLSMLVALLLFEDRDLA